MGHASIQITIDTYGSAFRAKPRMGVAMLDRGVPAAAGGRLWATRNPDRGMTFSFTLPVRQRDEIRAA